MASGFRTLRNVVVVACALSLAAIPALAKDLADQVDSAVNAFNQAIDDEDAGRYSDACIGYRNAASRFENAIYSLVGMSMQTEEDRERIKAYADHLQDNVDDAKAGATRVCSR